MWSDFRSGEWVLTLIIIGLVFGVGKLPQMGDAIGRTVDRVRGRTPAPPPAEHAGDQ